MNSEQILFNDVAPTLLESGFLTLRDYVRLQSAQKKPKDWLSFARYFRPGDCTGLQRLRMWRVSLNSGKFNESVYLAQNLVTTSVSSAPADTSAVSDPVIVRYRRALEGVNVEDITRFSSGVEGEIMRDVLRTFQNLPFFQEDHLGRVMLAKVLVAVSRTADPTVGYCQGMNFVVGIFLQSAVPDPDAQEASLLEDRELQEQIESRIFDLMLALIDKDGKLCMLGLWAEKIPKLKLRVYQLDRLLRWFCPRLHAHFSVIELSPEVLTAQWFITLFAYTLSAKDTMRIWDYVFLSGWEGLFRVAVSLLGTAEQVLLQVSDMEGVSMLMKQWRSHSRGMLLDELTVEEVLDKARQQSERQLTEEALLKLSEAYAWELLLLGQLRCRELGLIDNTADSCTGTTTSADSEQENKPSGNMNNNTGRSGDSSPDKPTYWLTRYAYKLTPPVSLELSQISQTIRRLDSQIDTDKGMMTQKILAACATHSLLVTQRQCVSQCVSQLQYRAARLRRRVDRVATQAKNVARQASDVCFALQQVQLLDTQLQIAQNTGKMPRYSSNSAASNTNSHETDSHTRYSDSDEGNNGNSAPNGHISGSTDSHRRGRLLHRLLFKSPTSSTIITSKISSYERQGSIDSEVTRKSINHSSSGFVFGGSRIGHKPHSLHLNNGDGHVSDDDVPESNEAANIATSGSRISRRQRLRALLMPSSSQSYLSPSKSSSAKGHNLHNHTQVLQGLQNLVSGMHDFLLSTTSSTSSAASSAASAFAEKGFSLSQSNPGNTGTSNSGWSTSALPAMMPALTSVLSYYSNNSSPLPSAEKHRAGDSQFLSSATASSLLPMSTSCDFNMYILPQLQLQLQPPFSDQEFQLLGDLDRDSIVNSNSNNNYYNNNRQNISDAAAPSCSIFSSDSATEAFSNQLTRNAPSVETEAFDDALENVVSVAERLSVDADPAEQLRRLEIESRDAQRRMIVLQRALSETERILDQQERLLLHLSLREEEANDFKSRLCDQLHLLVEDSNRGRAQKLLYVADHFLI